MDVNERVSLVSEQRNELESKQEGSSREGKFKRKEGRNYPKITTTHHYWTLYERKYFAVFSQ